MHNHPFDPASPLLVRNNASVGMQTLTFPHTHCHQAISRKRLMEIIEAALSIVAEDL
jgi:hypothetical protein